MKKMLLMICLLLTGCSYNKNEEEKSYIYKIHLYETNKCYPVDKKYAVYYECFIVDIKDYGMVYVPQIKCMLIKNKCPICDS